MKHILKRGLEKFRGSEFTKNVITLSTGTIIAQIIPFIISPILSRLFSPEEFGIFALYMSISSIISIVATGRYELAIMLPKDDNDAINIMGLSLSITTIVSFIVLLVVLIFNDSIVNLLNNDNINNWLYLMPFSILIAGAFQNFNYYIIRKKKFKKLAIAKVNKSVISGSSNIGLGLFNFSGGLILGAFLGEGITTYYLGRKIFNSEVKILKEIKKTKMLRLAKRYIDFLRFDLFAGLFSVLTSQSIIILLGIYFNSIIVGIYSLTNRVLVAPIHFIGKAILDVFRQRATEDYNKRGRCDSIFKKTFFILVSVSFIPFLGLFFFAEEIFSFVFGEQWQEAGKIAEILTPMFFLKFISSPLSYMFYIAEKQKQNMIWQFLLFLLTMLSFIIGVSANSKEILFICISIVYSLFYGLYIYLSYKFSLGNNRIVK